MNEIVSLSIGIGLVVSLFFSEMLGLTAGGMVVPGYVALYLDRPMTLIITLVVSYLTYFIVHSLSAVMIIYGRRRTVLMILVGFAMGFLIRSLSPLELPMGAVDLTVIGYIIPGLIAIWIDRQGFVESMSALIVASTIVRLLLILITGGELKI
jgi:poly-gamma-glutamate biosynthesis protein PgsC/CapC